MLPGKIRFPALFTLIVLLLLGGASAVKAEEDVTGYRVWVAGKQITSANASDVFGDGTVSYVSSSLYVGGV